MNNVILIGRLTKEPEVRYKDDLAIARFMLAVNRMPSKKGEDKGADFIGIIAFGRSAENCEKFLKKGSQIAIQGRIQSGSYTKKDGTTGFRTDVIADRIKFLDTKTKTHKDESDAAIAEEAIEEDIPF